MTKRTRCLLTFVAVAAAVAPAGASALPQAGDVPTVNRAAASSAEMADHCLRMVRGVDPQLDDAMEEMMRTQLGPDGSMDRMMGEMMGRRP